MVTKENRYVVFGMLAFYLLVDANIWIAYTNGIRTFGYFVMVSVIMSIFIIINEIMNIRNKQSRYVRYVMLIGLCVVDFIVAYAFENEFLKLFGIIPLIGCILYYDRKFLNISVIALGVINTYCFIDKVFVQKVIPEEQISDTSGHFLQY